MILEKLVTVDQLCGKLCVLRAGGGSVVFTNGCFDIIHAGHVTYLEHARRLGDCLVVAINSDCSIKRLKGEKRPVVNEGDRLTVLAALASVDYVVVFNEDTPYEIIKLLQPDILVKGGDWPVEQIVGGDIVEQRGGKVLAIPFLDDRSTTSMIEKILALYSN